MSREERAEAAEEADVDARADRSQHREHMRDLKDLANRIAELPQGLRRTLPFDEETQAQFDLLAAAAGRTDRRRVLMRAKLLLDSVDLDRLDAAMRGDTDAAAANRACESWRKRLLAGDDATLQAFIQENPDADRQAIRTAVRDARRPGVLGERASARLLTLLRSAYAGISNDQTRLPTTTA